MITTIVPRSAWLDPRPPLCVVHLVTSLAIGGLEKVVLDLVRHRTRNRFGARVICLDRSGVLQQAFAELCRRVGDERRAAYYDARAEREWEACGMRLHVERARAGRG